jgi:hypothetical protein
MHYLIHTSSPPGHTFVLPNEPQYFAFYSALTLLLLLLLLFYSALTLSLFHMPPYLFKRHENQIL